MAKSDPNHRKTGLRGLARDVRLALNDHTPIPFSRRLQATTAGFKPESAVAFEFHKNDFRDYLPDASWRALSNTNGAAARSMLANKLLFYLRYHHELPLPRVHGLVAAGQAVPLPGPSPIATIEQVVDHLAEVGPLIVKPIDGDRGRGVHLLESHDGRLMRDGKLIEKQALFDYLRSRDGLLFVEKVEQARYSRDIFPDSTNSIRLNVFGGAGTEAPFVAVAGHRFGRPDSAPVDNTSKGALICEVELDTGTLGLGRHLPSRATGYLWFERHPDTAAQLKGTEVPGFDEIVAAVLEFSARHPYLAYVGWDVVKTEEGFVVLEANHHASIRIQVTKPFLKDERVVAFLAHHDLLPPHATRRARPRRRRLEPAPAAS